MPTLDSSEDTRCYQVIYLDLPVMRRFMQEYELEGPCEEAGLRLKAKLWIAAFIAGLQTAADVSLVMWVDGAQSTPIVTTTTTDYSQSSGNW